MMIYRVVFLLVLGSMSVGTFGADIFKWIDEKGQIHYGTSVPDRYKAAATKIDREKSEPTDAQRQDAEARAAKDKAKAESIVTPEAKSNKPRSDSRPLPAAARTDDKESKCAAEMGKYMESQACFAPYRTATGGIKEEAFQHCVEVKEPKC
jgi:hypothetical protein